MAVLLLVLGLLLVVVGTLHLLINGFRERILWGLGMLIIPLLDWVFTFCHWREWGRTPFFTRIAGLGLIFLALMSDGGMRAELVDKFRSKYGLAEQADPADLTAEINDQRLKIEHLEGQFSQATNDVAAEYKKLTAARAALKATDAEAVEKFNALAADYQRRNLALKDMQQVNATARAELTRMLDERAKLTAQAGPQGSAGAISANSGNRRVVMYTTSTCPACKAAKQYFARKGVIYEEIDVETSPAGRADFQKLGGRGVPLILVGDRRMEGFSAQQLDAML